MRKIKKILRAVSEKTALPTNQPIITNNTDYLGPCWHRSNNLNAKAGRCSVIEKYYQRKCNNLTWDDLNFASINYKIEHFQLIQWNLWIVDTYRS